MKVTRELIILFIKEVNKTLQDEPIAFYTKRPKKEISLRGDALPLAEDSQIDILAAGNESGILLVYQTWKNLSSRKQ